MIEYTTEKLEDLGYKLENALIKDVDLSMADHGCITFRMVLDGDGWGCVYGNCNLGHGYLGAETFDSYPDAMEYIMRIMDAVGCNTFNGMKGRYVRVATKGWGGTIKVIGNIIKDNWFDTESFFADKENENENGVD